MHPSARPGEEGTLDRREGGVGLVASFRPTGVPTRAPPKLEQASYTLPAQRSVTQVTWTRDTEERGESGDRRLARGRVGGAGPAGLAECYSNGILVRTRP